MTDKEPTDAQIQYVIEKWGVPREEAIRMLKNKDER